MPGQKRAQARADAGDANSAKLLGARAGYQAALQAVMTRGGMGYAKEYHVERLLHRHR